MYLLQYLLGWASIISQEEIHALNVRVNHFFIYLVNFYRIMYMSINNQLIKQ